MTLPHNVKIDDQLVWTQVFESAQRFSDKSPALFLDRDGVIVEEVHYLHKVEDVRLIDGAADLIAKANARDIPVVVVTNQSGVARGMYGWDEFNNVQQRMLELLNIEANAFVDAVYASPHHKDGNEPYNRPDHEARKPNPGMFLRAMKALPIEASNSWIIGDTANDMKAGLNAGLKNGVHVLTGHGSDGGEAEKAKALQSEQFNVRSEGSIKGALDLF